MNDFKFLDKCEGPVFHQDEPGLKGPVGPLNLNILGANYMVAYADEKSCPKLKNCDGICDPSVKRIVVDNMQEAARQPESQADLMVHRAKVLRHEILHAFLCESGLMENSDWARNEEMIDWFAIQGPKIWKAWQEAKAV